MIEIPSPLLEFVSIADNRLVTDTLRVAKYFHKRHKDVLRTYDNLQCSPEFNERNFAPIEYVDSRGRLKRMVQMRRDGFMFLAMAFTGAEAARIKEAFIPRSTTCALSRRPNSADCCRTCSRCMRVSRR
ncbi:Rha family transcriptional regulator [Paraburkholderia sediminicola]